MSAFDKLAELTVKCLNTGETQRIPDSLLEEMRQEMRQVDACACIGPAGDCPCIRRANGLPVDIPETHIHESLWKLLTDEEKTTVNEIKQRALERYLSK
mgnify:CR=1 FL=1